MTVLVIKLLTINADSRNKKQPKKLLNWSKGKNPKLRVSSYFHLKRMMGYFRLGYVTQGLENWSRGN